MTFLLASGLVWLALVAFLVVQFHRAPHGYQDERGFHFAKGPALARAPRRVASRAGMRHHGMRLSHAGFMR